MVPARELACWPKLASLVAYSATCRSDELSWPKQALVISAPRVGVQRLN
jgi:hypothetical protein